MSAEILQFQKNLRLLGLDPGPLDGQSGSRTRGAAHDAASKYGWPQQTGEATAEFMALVAAQVLKIQTAKVALPPNYVDLTRVAATIWRKGPIAWTDRYALTVHQSGCPLTDIPDAELAFFKQHDAITQQDTPSLMRWAKQRQVDEDGKPAFDAQGNPLYAALKAPFGITYSGKILQIHPVDVWGYDAQGLSKRGIGVEIAGLFCGIEGDMSTRPGAPASWKVQSVTTAQIAACKELARYLKRLLQSHGSDLREIHPHRCATDDRRPDPGSKAWKEIAIPLMAELGLTDGGPHFTLGKGTEAHMELPDAWSGQNNGIPY